MTPFSSSPFETLTTLKPSTRLSAANAQRSGGFTSSSCFLMVHAVFDDPRLVVPTMLTPWTSSTSIRLHPPLQPVRCAPLQPALACRRPRRGTHPPPGWPCSALPQSPLTSSIRRRTTRRLRGNSGAPHVQYVPLPLAGANRRSGFSAFEYMRLGLAPTKIHRLISSRVVPHTT